MKMREVSFLSFLFISFFKIMLEKISEYSEKGKPERKCVLKVVFNIMNHLLLMERVKNFRELENISGSIVHGSRFLLEFLPFLSCHLNEHTLRH